ncbi:hypothetical protein [Methanobrevibacter sp.]|uniref:hypothetical protein n=1 Tax=Methanobrevibacter sp. TaxID=66852 RepID=UPI0026007535|nr:hypothetical protein [Methanobrevibacter sp.]MBR4447957.1 hypothetical protein [Methanobrevibacter sp.]
MNLNKKIIILSIFIFFISLCAVYSVYDSQNTDNTIVNLQNNNETDVGCCSVVLQLENDSSILSYRRDANLTADIHIDKIIWHGIPAIKQHKTDYGYFNHVIITDDGWVIGLGGLDDGIDNERCENITATMINDNYTISEEKLEEIQAIKIPYKMGHVVIKAPNGNYGFATPTKLKTGHLKPGQYISIPNNYYYSRAGEIPLNTTDKIKVMTDLARSDMFGLSRRAIVTYDIHINGNNNTTDIYVSNDDGSLFDMQNLYDIDDIYYNNTVIKGEDIPIAPDYKYIESISFVKEDSLLDNLFILLSIIGFVIFVGILFYVIYQFVVFMRYRR